jgi:hypothetical protein
LLLGFAHPDLRDMVSCRRPCKHLASAMSTSCLPAPTRKAIRATSAPNMRTARTHTYGRRY